MANKTPFSPASEKGHFDGLVDEGKPLRQKLAFRAEFAKNTKLAENLRKSAPSASKNSCSFVDYQYAIRSTNSYVRNYQQNMQNEPNFRKSQVNVTFFITMNYDQMDTWSIRKNEPKTNPNEPKVKMGKINITTCLTMNYEQRTMNDEKKRTQNEPNFKGQL